MPAWLWIVLVLVVVVLAALAVGAFLGRRRRVSLVAPQAAAVITPSGPVAPAKGGYRTGSSISFSAGTQMAPVRSSGTPTTAARLTPDRGGAHPAGERTETDGQPGVGDDASVPRDSMRAGLTDVNLPEPAENGKAPVDGETAQIEDGTAPTQQQGKPSAAEAAQRGESSAAQATQRDQQSAAEAAQRGESSAAEVGEALQIPLANRPVHQGGRDSRVSGDWMADDPAHDVPDLPVELPPDQDLAARQAAAAAEDAEQGAEAALAEVVGHPAEGATTSERPRPITDIAPTAGRLRRLRGRLSRSQNAFGRSLLGLLGAGTLDEDSWTEVEDTLLMADLGTSAALEITASLRGEVAAHGVTDSVSARAMLRRVLVEAVSTGPTGRLDDRSVRALPHDGRPAVLLVVGVNGTGKTTTTGKLARVLVADGRSVVLGAADTFRAAAADQLATWAERAGATVVRGAQGADPAAVAFDAVKAGVEQGVDAVLIDTAGRLHTKTGLMDELGKVKRVVEKQAKVDEVLLVLDATTGQNGLTQAKVFADVVDITGIVLTKLDGTAKGGIVVAVQRTLGVPVKLVGLGEGADDLAPFEPEAFVDALLGD